MDQVFLFQTDRRNQTVQVCLIDIVCVQIGDRNGNTVTIACGIVQFVMIKDPIRVVPGAFVLVHHKPIGHFAVGKADEGQPGVVLHLIEMVIIYRGENQIIVRVPGVGLNIQIDAAKQARRNRIGRSCQGGGNALAVAESRW